MILFQRTEMLYEVCCFMGGEALQQAFWHQRYRQEGLEIRRGSKSFGATRTM